MRNLNSFLPTLRLNSDGLDGAGGGSGDSGNMGGDGGGSGGGDQGGSQYVSRKDYDSLSSKFSQTESQLRELSNWRQEQARKERESQESRNNGGAPQSPKEPRISDYDFKDPIKSEAEIKRYNRDMFRYEQHVYEQENSSKRSQEEATRKQTESNAQIRREHEGRVKEYEKENPGFRDRLNKAPIEIYEGLRPLVFSSELSPALIDHLISNPETVAELNSVAENAGDNWHAAASRYLGRIENRIESEKNALKANMNAASVIPPRNLGKGMSGKTKTSDEAMYKDWQS